MRSYMRDVNLGRETQPHIPAAVGMTEEQIYDMYRLLAIAKYEERYVIPVRTLPVQDPSKNPVAAAVFDGGRVRVGPFGEASGMPVPVAVETFHALQHRQTGEGMAANAARPSRVNLLNWDGRGTPAECSRPGPVDETAHPHPVGRPAGPHGVAGASCCSAIPTPATARGWPRPPNCWTTSTGPAGMMARATSPRCAELDDRGAAGRYVPPST
jgi:hypothetical protein